MLGAVLSSAASQSFLVQRIARTAWLAANAPAGQAVFLRHSRRCSSSSDSSPPAAAGGGSGRGKGDGKGDAASAREDAKSESEANAEDGAADSSAVAKSDSPPPQKSKSEGGGGREGGGRGRRPSLFQRILKASGGDKNKASQEAAASEAEAAKDGKEAAEESSQRAIVPAGPKPENFPKVLALPLTRRPLFPGFYAPIQIKDPKLADSLIELRARGTPYVGAFLLRSSDSVREDVTEDAREEAGSGKLSDKESRKDADLKGEALYKRLHEYGTFAQVLNVIRSVDSDGPAQVFLMGHRRLRLTGMVADDPLTVSVDHLKDKPYDEGSDIIKATFMEVVASLRDLMRYNPLYKETIQVFVQNMGNSHINAARLADFGSALTTADEPLLQEVLEQLDVEKRLTLALTLLKKELELAKLQASIAKSVEEKITGDQRRFFLMEQLKAIKKELGLEADDKTALTLKFKERLEPNRKGCPEHVLQVIDEELSKLQGLESSSSEFNVTRNYLDWLTCLPWGHYSMENFNVREAQKTLDEDHYGLTDVKERILEFIAVGKLRGTAVGKIICLSGPPGVGKTSIGKSIAKALNRKFFRFSVGGLSDVAEIKGHRRTYVGAMPGKMVQCLKATGTANPLVLIDEIDKLGRGHAGDPASALLELLDPEQNANFLDHYLDVPIDLTKVLFVCTANLVENIPAPLLDRMEVIRLVGYITDEKMHIARGYLEKQARETSGIKEGQVELTDAALHCLIETYCREAGVRNLQKHIEKIYRKIALKFVRQQLESSEKQGEAASQADTPTEETKQAIEVVAMRMMEQLEEITENAIIEEKVFAKKVASMGSSDVLEVEVADVVPAEPFEVDATTAVKQAEDEEEEPVADLPAELYESSHPCYKIAPEAMEIKLKMAAATRLAEVAAKRAAKLVAASESDKAQASDADEKSAKEEAVLEKITVDVPNLHEYVGIPVFQSDRLYEQTPVGVVMGLAWTAMGGSTLYVETSLIEQGDGKAGLQLTGQLGDVMKESASIAHTVARRLLRDIDPDNQFFANSKLHLHVPAGATPKDGPSAGCTMISSMLSLALDKPVKKDVAMTGEVTLTGRVLPIGGVKEKTVASRRSGVKEIIFPGGNKRDYDEVLPHVKEGMVAHFVETYHEILDIVFPKEADTTSTDASSSSDTSSSTTTEVTGSTEAEKQAL